MKPALNLLILEKGKKEIVFIKDLFNQIETYELTETYLNTAYMNNLKQGIQYLETHHLDLILLDLFLEDSKGIESFERFHQINAAKDIPIIILTSPTNTKIGIEAIKKGAQQYLVINELSARILLISIRYAIERQQLHLRLNKETEELKKNELRFFEIITNTPDGMIIILENKEIQFVNPTAEILLGKKSDELIGKTFPYPLVSNENQSKEIEIIRYSYEKSTVVTVEMRGVKIDWRGEDACLISLRDITRKKNLINEFRREKEQLDFTLRSIADGVLATDENGILRLINRMAIQMTGWSQEEALGKPLTEVIQIKNSSLNQSWEISSKKFSPFRNNCNQENRVNAHDCILVSRTGEEYPIEYSYAPIHKNNQLIGTVLIIHDITIKKDLEEESVRAQNLEALGVLAAGISHQYSNILTATLGYISLAKVVTDENHPILPRLQKAEEAALRAKEISYRLYTFAKGGEPNKTKDSIIPTIEQAIQDIINTIFPKISIKWESPPGLWPVSFDHQQFQLAIRNILKNAVEATNFKESEIITIKIENLRIPELKSSAIKKGNYVKISIIDKGKGIAAEHQPKLFDAYFTTKERAEGMGLTTSYSVIRKHGGWLRVKSKEGLGTVVTILLPAAITLEGKEMPGEAAHLSLNEDVPSSEKRKRILVMDDEDLVREIAQEMLQFLEYEAILVGRGEDALEFYRSALQSGNPFDAVILDLVVPTGMGGKECIKKLLQLDPKIKAIVSSGYSEDPVIANYEDYGFCGILPKPYKIHEFSETLKIILQENNNEK